LRIANNSHKKYISAARRALLKLLSHPEAVEFDHKYDKFKTARSSGACEVDAWRKDGVILNFVQGRTISQNYGMPKGDREDSELKLKTFPRKGNH